MVKASKETSLESYKTINLPNDTCMNCGYTDEINDCCPKCNSTKINRLRRVTGYLTGNYITAFNPGKQAEVLDRIKHLKNFNNYFKYGNK